MNRYVRQIAVSEFGPEGQARLRAGRVLVVGAGALAAPVLQYLVGAGVGRIVLVDPDRVALSNLHRQTLFREDDVGASKALVAARHLAALNSECEIEPVIGTLAPDTVAALCSGIDLVLDCADAFAVSYVLSDHCHAVDLPLISASVLGISGYCGGFCGGAPSLRAVFPDLPERAGSCSTDGVLGPVVGVVGAIQAQMALAVLTGMKSSPLGRLVSFDANSWRFGGFSFVGAQEPQYAPRFVAPSEIRANDFVVDLRAEDEAALATPAARRLPVAAFGEGGPTPALGQRAVLCCRSGLRSWQAAERLGRVWRGEIVLVAFGAPETDSNSDTNTDTNSSSDTEERPS